MSAAMNPMARPSFSSGTFFCTSVRLGPFIHAQAMAMNALSAANAQKPVLGRKPHAAVVAPTMTLDTMMSLASFLPPPQAMMIAEPTSMPMPHVASAMEAMYPSPPKCSSVISG